jgi:membrane-bound lytic murein transglycosylase B
METFIVCRLWIAFIGAACPMHSAPPKGDSICVCREASAFVTEMVARQPIRCCGFNAIVGANVMKQRHPQSHDAAHRAKPWAHIDPVRQAYAHRAQENVFWAEHEAALVRFRSNMASPHRLLWRLSALKLPRPQHRFVSRDGRTEITLAFGYPQRAAYFRDELEQYLLLARATFAPLSIKGSSPRWRGDGYRGQFDLRATACLRHRFDGDGHRDLSGKTQTCHRQRRQLFSWQRWQICRAPVAFTARPQWQSRVKAR